MGRRTQISFSIKRPRREPWTCSHEKLDAEDFKKFPPFCSASLHNGAESFERKNEEILHLPLCAIREPLSKLGSAM